MNSQNINIIDETFDIDRSESYVLSVQISNKGYSFTIKDTVKESFLVLNETQFDNVVKRDDDWTDVIKGIFSKNDILNQKFKQVFFSYESELFTLIPAELFVDSKAKQLFTLVWDLPEAYELHYKEINKIVLLYAVPSTLVTTFKQKQSKATIIGYPMPLLNTAKMTMATSNDPFVMANISNKFMINVVAQSKTIKSCTPYPYQSIDDIAYFIVNSCKQLDLTPSNLNLIVSGINHLDQSLMQLLSKFFKKVAAEKSLLGDHYVYSLEKYKNQYWNLFNISQCE